MKIIVFPKDPNPYQESLYTEMRKQHHVVEYLTAPIPSHTMWICLLLIPQIIYKRLYGYRIFHIHWVYPFQFPSKNKLLNNSLTQRIFYYYFKLVIFTVKLCGYKLVWTVHNILPHNKVFFDEIKARSFLADNCDMKIVHNFQTINNLKELGIDTSNTHIVPQGNFGNVSSTKIEQHKARQLLNIPKDNFTLLFFGKVEYYKGIISLIEEFNTLKLSDSTLVIAGECKDKELKAKIENSINKSNTYLFLKYIDEKDINVFFSATNVAVFPFLKITNSASIMLSMSYGIPPIYPLIDYLKEIPDGIGFSYNLNERSLKDAITMAYINKDNYATLSKNCVNYSNSYRWDDTASKTLALYNKLLTAK